MECIEVGWVVEMKVKVKREVGRGANATTLKKIKALERSA